VNARGIMPYCSEVSGRVIGIGRLATRPKPPTCTVV